MNELQVFNFKDNEVRIVEKDLETWFCLKDVCDVLEIKNATDVSKRLNAKGRTRYNLGRQGETTFINESNLYKVVFQSRKKGAEQFTEYVTGTILPSVRKHGAYMTEQAIEQVLVNPDTIIRLATELKEERNKRILLEKQISATDVQSEQMRISLEESEKLYTATEVARMFGTNARALNDLLRSKRIIKLTNGSVWNLNANYENKGYAKKLWKNLRWTESGVEFLKKKLKANGLYTQ